MQAYHSKLKFAFCLQVVSFREPPVRTPSPVRSERAKSPLRPAVDKTSYKKAASKASVRRTASEFPLKEDKIITSSVRNAATKVSVRRTATESVTREERKPPVKKATEGLKPSTVITSPAAKPQVRSRMMPESDDDDDDDDSSALISEYEATLEETGRSM